jgi:prevent-host-death family protein
MTDRKPERRLGISEFKSRCLSLIDDLQRDGGSLVVTRRGKPVAQVLPYREKARGSIAGLLRHEGTVAKGIADFSLADRWESAQK